MNGPRNKATPHGPLAKAGQRRELDYFHDRIIFIQLHTFNAAGLPPHVAHLGFLKAHRHAAAGGQNNLVLAVGNADADEAQIKK